MSLMNGLGTGGGGWKDFAFVAALTLAFCIVTVVLDRLIG